jgi:diguanylate cyclase (GGDEF)-like protein
VTTRTSRAISTEAALEREAAARDRQKAAAERRHAAALFALACRDDLTGALTRRGGQERMTAEINRSRRTKAPLCVVFVDVDGLKSVNDDHGHRAGDEVLAAVGTALRESLRGYDLVIRYGGDEFLCVLPGADQSVAEAALGRARGRAAKLGHRAKFTAGFAMLRDTDKLEDVVRRADADLYARRRSAGPNNSRAAHTTSAAMDNVADYPTSVVLATVGCGQCGEQIPLADFSSPTDENARRSANCLSCGATTVIQLVSPRSD